MPNDPRKSSFMRSSSLGLGRFRQSKSIKYFTIHSETGVKIADVGKAIIRHATRQESPKGALLSSGAASPSSAERCLLLKDYLIGDSCFQFNVEKLVRNRKLERRWLIDVRNQTITNAGSKGSPDGEKKFPASSLIKIERSLNDSRCIRVIFSPNILLASMSSSRVRRSAESEDVYYDLVTPSPAESLLFCVAASMAQRGLSIPAVVNDLQLHPATEEVRVCVSTWNLGNAPPPDDLTPWAPPGYDVYAIGAQECLYEVEGDLCERDWFTRLDEHLEGYKRVRKVCLWEIRLAVYVRDSCLHKVTQVETSTETTGIMKVMGNKGGTAIAFRYNDTPMAFINVHLAAHQHKVQARNENVVQILGNLLHEGHSHSLLNRFDHIFFFGDMNYRIDFPSFDAVTRTVGEQDWTSLMKSDQLNRELAESGVLHGFEDGDISFPPTFKLKRPRTSDVAFNPQRLPAYCDRILVRTLPGCAPVRRDVYTSAPEMTTSDHNAVFAGFSVQSRDVYFQFLTQGVRFPGAPPPKVCKIVFPTICACDLNVEEPESERSGHAFTGLYLSFHAKFLSKPHHTTLVPKESNPIWSGEEIPPMYPFIIHKEFLAHQHIVVTVHHSTRSSREAQSLAQCVVPLDAACQAALVSAAEPRDPRQANVSFEIPLKFAGKDCGTLRGSVCAFWIDDDRLPTGGSSSNMKRTVDARTWPSPDTTPQNLDTLRDIVVPKNIPVPPPPPPSAAKHRAVWVPDQVAAVCSTCSKPFSTLRRRHHCRSCGKVFCNNCSAYKAVLPQVNDSRPHRVCVSCFERLRFERDVKAGDIQESRKRTVATPDFLEETDESSSSVQEPSLTFGLPRATVQKDSVSPAPADQAVAWEPDRGATNCAGCTRKFTQVRRRHHCRQCGKVFCGSCTPHRIKLSFDQKEQRCCVQCYQRKLTSMQMAQSAAKEAMTEDTQLTNFALGRDTHTMSRNSTASVPSTISTTTTVSERDESSDFFSDDEKSTCMSASVSTTSTTAVPVPDSALLRPDSPLGRRGSADSMLRTEVSAVSPSHAIHSASEDGITDGADSGNTADGEFSDSDAETRRVGVVPVRDQPLLPMFGYPTFGDDASDTVSGTPPDTRKAGVQVTNCLSPPPTSKTSPGTPPRLSSSPPHSPMRSMSSRPQRAYSPPLSPKQMSSSPLSDASEYLKPLRNMSVSSTEAATPQGASNPSAFSLAPTAGVSSDGGDQRTDCVQLGSQAGATPSEGGMMLLEQCIVKSRTTSIITEAPSTSQKAVEGGGGAIPAVLQKAAEETFGVVQTEKARMMDDIGDSNTAATSYAVVQETTVTETPIAYPHQTPHEPTETPFICDTRPSPTLPVPKPLSPHSSPPTSNLLPPIPATSSDAGPPSESPVTSGPAPLLPPTQTCAEDRRSHFREHGSSDRLETLRSMYADPDEDSPQRSVEFVAAAEAAGLVCGRRRSRAGSRCVVAPIIRDDDSDSGSNTSESLGGLDDDEGEGDDDGGGGDVSDSGYIDDCSRSGEGVCSNIGIVDTPVIASTNSALLSSLSAGNDDVLPQASNCEAAAPGHDGSGGDDERSQPCDCKEGGMARVPDSADSVDGVDGVDGAQGGLGQATRAPDRGAKDSEAGSNEAKPAGRAVKMRLRGTVQRRATVHVASNGTDPSPPRSHTHDHPDHDGRPIQRQRFFSEVPAGRALPRQRTMGASLSAPSGLGIPPLGRRRSVVAESVESGPVLNRRSFRRRSTMHGPTFHPDVLGGVDEETSTATAHPNVDAQPRPSSPSEAIGADGTNQEDSSRVHPAVLELSKRRTPRKRRASSPAHPGRRGSISVEEDCMIFRGESMAHKLAEEERHRRLLEERKIRIIEDAERRAQQTLALRLSVNEQRRRIIESVRLIKEAGGPGTEELTVDGVLEGSTPLPRPLSLRRQPDALVQLDAAWRSQGGIRLLREKMLNSSDPALRRDCEVLMRLLRRHDTL
eukprot:Rmarinus@m.17019